LDFGLDWCFAGEVGMFRRRVFMREIFVRLGFALLLMFEIVIENFNK